jgi:hypothetical protein
MWSLDFTCQSHLDREEMHAVLLFRHGANQGSIFLLLVRRLPIHIEIPRNGKFCNQHVFESIGIQQEIGFQLGCVPLKAADREGVPGNREE